MGLIIAPDPPPCLIGWNCGEFRKCAEWTTPWKAYGTAWMPDYVEFRDVLRRVWPRHLVSNGRPANRHGWHGFGYLSPWECTRPPEICELADVIRERKAGCSRIERYEAIGKMIPLIFERPDEAQRIVEAALAFRLLSRTDRPDRRVV